MQKKSMKKSGGCAMCGNGMGRSNPPKKTGGAIKVGGGVNPWLAHVKKFRASHPNLTYKQVLVEAKKTYKGGKSKTPKVSAKTKKDALGGALEDLLAELG